MKIATAIFLLVLMVSMQTPVGQFFRLPLLIEHFIKHQKQDGVSLISFLYDHYSSNHNDADLSEDEQLPFKNITFYAVDYATVPDVIKTNIILSLAFNKMLIFSETYALHQHLGSIFRPPKV